MNERKFHHFRPGEMIVLIVIGLLVLSFLTESYKPIVAWLYSPYAAVVAVVMVVEYLLLKGSDRSAIYRRERDAAREIRRDDLLAMRDLETKVVDLRARLASALERDDDVATVRGHLEHARDVSDAIVRVLRARI
ncbi:MAG: hypothetical protein LUQ59_12275 [Methanothrix sp.]|nr:hypothetical protein [Methanothrix sp.]